MPSKKQKSKRKGRELDSICVQLEDSYTSNQFTTSTNSNSTPPLKVSLGNSDYHKLVLNKRRTYILTNLDLHSHAILLDHLMQNDVITKDQYDCTKTKKGKERVTQLLDTLATKDAMVFFKFVESLRETGDDFIADELLHLCQKHKLYIPDHLLLDDPENMHTSFSTDDSYFSSSQNSVGQTYQTVRHRFPTTESIQGYDMQLPHSELPLYRNPDVVNDFTKCRHGRANCFYCSPEQPFSVRGLKIIPNGSTYHEKTRGEFKVILLGKSNAGKSSLLSGFLNSDFKHVMPTVGLDEQARSFEYKKNIYTFVFQDTGGQERFNALTDNYVRDAHGVLFVYDVNEQEAVVRASLEQCMEWKEKLDINQTAFRLAGNKMDIVTEEKQKIALGIIKEFPGLSSIKSNLTSAVTGLHVGDIFYNLILDVINNSESQNEVQRGSNVNLKSPESRNKRQGRCCHS